MELIRGGTWQMLLQFFMLESMRTLPFNAGSEAWIKGPLSLSLFHTHVLYNYYQLKWYWFQVITIGYPCKPCVRLVMKRK